MNLQKDLSRSYSNKMLGIVLLLFLLFAGCFLFFQNGREKQYRIALLDQKLLGLNGQIHQYLLSRPGDFDMSDCVLDYSGGNLRITLIDREGVVLYDNMSDSIALFDNHLQRREIVEARRFGHGNDICRQSENIGGDFYYCATWFHNDGYYVRTALPYDASLIRELSDDKNYLYFAIAVFVILAGVLLLFNRRLSVYRQIKQMQDALLVEREKLLTHLRISREGLGVFSSRRRALLVNPLFTKYADTISDTPLTTIETIFATKDFAPVTRFLDETDAGHVSGERIGNTGERRLTYNISTAGMVFEVNCVVFLDHSFEVSVNDITERDKQTNLKRQLTQNVSHELRTPVSSIQGYLETIMRTPDLDAARVRHFIERCYVQSTRLTNMLRDISVLTKMDEAQGPTEMREIALEDIVDEVVDDLREEIAGRNMTIAIDIPHGLPMKGNATLLYSVFRNLIENSVAYAGEGTHMELRLFRRDREYYYFSYSDNGVGVPEEHLPRLFERFYRVDGGRSRKMGGTGLGLAIVKNAIILHGGSISAKPHAGKGLEFIFTLRAPYNLEKHELAL